MATIMSLPPDSQTSPNVPPTRLNRVPTLTFPPLHLGSFNGLDADSFPSPPGSGTRDRAMSVQSTEMDRLDARQARSRESSSGSIRRGPPSLPPPNMALPSLPPLSPLGMTNGTFAALQDDPVLKDAPGTPRRLTQSGKRQSVTLDDMDQLEITHRLEHKPSTNDLRASPPVAKRSLPRPPLEINTTLPNRTSSRPEPKTHRPNASASALPVIAGLADAGPYAFPKPAPIGLGRPRQEEVCLECMMRDRDLADVDVSAPGAWSRASDVAMDELKWREEGLIKSMGEASSEESSVDDPTRQRVRAQKQEMDHRVLKEVGWRGFKWEEGSGEGLPRGFRGTRGGLLTEDGIKAVMVKFPSASAHRYNSLQTYLRNQWALVVELGVEAKRLGYYPEPSESGTISSHEPLAGGSGFTSRTGPLAGSWDSGSVPVPRNVPLKSSPSTPADLSVRSRQNPPSRPVTHFIPEREPEQLALRQVRTNASARFADEDLYPPISPADSGMRPFSFAVRAGAVAQGSEGHGRKSFFGRWGGSVTSLFAGSQGGSGSMMDMHLGLDSERRNRTSSFNVHSQRAVSMASPTRPSFFSRDSRDSIDRQPIDRAERAGKSMSNSRLSQVHDEPTPKKKGIKGLLDKMKPRKKSISHTPPAMAYDQYVDQMPTSQLAPPPPLSYLVGRGDNKHARNQSGSSSSDVGVRSVSAPVDTSSSKSVSPTSSRFDRGDRGVNRRRGSGLGSGYIIDEEGARASSPALGYKKMAAGTTSSLSASSVVETPPSAHQALMYPLKPEHYLAPKTVQVVNPSAPLSPNRFKNLPPIPPPEDDPREGDFGQTPRQRGYGDTFGSRASPNLNNGTFNRFDSRPRASFDPADAQREREGMRGQAPARLAQSMYMYGPGQGQGGQGQVQQPFQQQPFQQQQMMSGIENGYGYGRDREEEEYWHRQMQMQRGQAQGQGRYANGNGNGNGSGQGQWQGPGQGPGQGQGSGQGDGSVRKKGLKGFFGGSKAGRLA